MSIPILRSYICRRGHRFLRAQLAPTYALSAPFSSQDSLQKKLLEKANKLSYLTYEVSLKSFAFIADSFKPLRYQT
ncbi:hypothetical protein M5689_012272 [Euphorbia peplus]|nr:hypothetical protein M5689_012272 [Euphorbia peplus]